MTTNPLYIPYLYWKGRAPTVWVKKHRPISIEAIAPSRSWSPQNNSNDDVYGHSWRRVPRRPPKLIRYSYRSSLRHHNHVFGLHNKMPATNASVLTMFPNRPELLSQWVRSLHVTRSIYTAPPPPLPRACAHNIARMHRTHLLCDNNTQNFTFVILYASRHTCHHHVHTLPCCSFYMP